MTERDREFVYVDVQGNVVSPDDPAVQTRYSRAEYEALDRAMVFGARDDEASPLLSDRPLLPPATAEDDAPAAAPAHPAVSEDEPKSTRKR